jgi:hypothetical protein
LDYAKAFDTVPHNRLLAKLLSYGIENDLVKWIRAFLSNRRQRVVLGETVSDWCNVTSGVPQGSVLGPQLFNIYINDLPRLLNNTSKLYADDTKIISIVDTHQQSLNLQNDLNKVQNWSKTWLMKLNTKKCKVMHFGKFNNNFKYQMQDTSSNNNMHTLETTTEERDLGVILSSDLKWKPHIDKITNKANSVLKMLKNTFTCREKELWKKLYTSLVRPHLEYASTAWNPSLASDINKIEKVQKRATKWSQPNTAYANRLANLGLTSLAKRRERGDCIETFKITNKIINIEDAFFNMKQSTNLRTFNNHQLQKDIYSSRQANDYSKAVKFRDNFLSNRVTQVWNYLPNSVIEASGATPKAAINKFKNNYDKFQKDKINSIKQ